MTEATNIVAESHGPFGVAFQRDCVCRKSKDRINRVKQFRKELDATLQQIRDGQSSDEIRVATEKIREAIMWLGLELERLNNGASCYWHGHDPSNAAEDALGL